MLAQIQGVSTPLPTSTANNTTMIAEIHEASTPLPTSTASNIAVPVSVSTAVYEGCKRINFHISTRFELGDGIGDISFAKEIKTEFPSPDRLCCFCRAEDKFSGGEVYVDITIKCILPKSTDDNISMFAEIHGAGTTLPKMNLRQIVTSNESSTSLTNNTASNGAVPVSVSEAVYEGPKRINFRISTICNMSFYVKSAELWYGNWYKQTPLLNATDSEINSIAINLTHDGIFGACRTPFAPNTTKGFFHIDLENKTHLLEHDFELGDGTDDTIFSTEIKPGFGSRDPLRCFCRSEHKFIGDEVYVNLTIECLLKKSTLNKYTMFVQNRAASTFLPTSTGSNISIPTEIQRASTSLPKSTTDYISVLARIHESSDPLPTCTSDESSI
ncbi:hypothetical protein U1Q18_049711 [Sarracenia purpurea var. burkii]